MTFHFMFVNIIFSLVWVTGSRRDCGTSWAFHIAILKHCDGFSDPLQLIWCVFDDN